MVCPDDDPLPPDIRPSCRYVTNEHPAVELRRNGAPRRKGSGGGALSSTLSVALATLALLPITLAAPYALPAQRSGSAPPAVSEPYAYDTHARARPTPILALLGIVWRWVHATLAARLGAEAQHAHTKRHMDGGHIAEACMIPVLVCLSGTFAGLTLGYFSVDQTQLQVLSISGTPRQQMYARRIMPIRKDSHLLLTTLILGNMIVNEALPVITDGVLGGGLYAVIISTALVVIFAEIIPQSVCSRYGLLIGASMAPVVRVIIVLFFPLAWPIAKLLEYILGAHHGIIYRRSELRELIRIHAAGAEGGGDLDVDTVTIAQGALDLAQKTVADAMTPIDDVFMLPLDAKLDYETLGRVVASGHSRIPVYHVVEVPDLLDGANGAGTKQVKKVLGCMLVKSCVLLDPEDATPLASIPINSAPSVPWDEPLTNMLNAFQEGRSHMAIVSRRGRVAHADTTADASSAISASAAAGGLRERFLRKVTSLGAGSSGSGGSSTASDASDGGEEGTVRQRRRRRSFFRRRASSTTERTATQSPTKTTEKGVGLSDPTKPLDLASRERSIPSDVELSGAGAQALVDGLEGAPLGIITLEDVLEELIGEEIWDEYDGGAVVRSPASKYVPPEAAAARAIAKEVIKTPLDASSALTPPMPPRRAFRDKVALGMRPASLPGRSRRDATPPPATPVDTGVVAIADHVLAPSEDDAPPHRSPSAPALHNAGLCSDAVAIAVSKSRSGRGRPRVPPAALPAPAPAAAPPASIAPSPIPPTMPILAPPPLRHHSPLVAAPMSGRRTPKFKSAPLGVTPSSTPAALPGATLDVQLS